MYVVQNQMNRIIFFYYNFMHLIYTHRAYRKKLALFLKNMHIYMYIYKHISLHIKQN